MMRTRFLAAAAATMAMSAFAAGGVAHAQTPAGCDLGDPPIGGQCTAGAEAEGQSAQCTADYYLLALPGADIVVAPPRSPCEATVGAGKTTDLGTATAACSAERTTFERRDLDCTVGAARADNGAGCTLDAYERDGISHREDYRLACGAERGDAAAQCSTGYYREWDERIFNPAALVPQPRIPDCG